MTQHYTTGPVLVYVGLASGGSPLFLGTAATKPRVTKKPHQAPVMNDVGGHVEPTDACFSRRQELITVTFNKFNYFTLERVQDYTIRLGGGNQTPDPGADPAGATGALMVTEGLTYRLWLVFPASLRPAYRNSSNGALPPGRRYAAVTCENDDLDEIGTTDLKNTLVWLSRGLYTPSLSGGSWRYWDQDMSGLPVPT